MIPRKRTAGTAVARRRQQLTGRNKALLSLIDRSIGARMAGDEPHADWLDYQVFSLAFGKVQEFAWRRA
jgi:hypothetical protein